MNPRWHIGVAEEMYRKNPKYTTDLAIPLMFYIGCRIGELAALKFSDIHGNYIHIQRMEVTAFDIDKDMNVKFKGRKVVEYTKSDAGDREVYLPEKAKKIIEQVRQSNEQYGLYDDDYIFVAHDNRKKLNTIQRVRAGSLSEKLIRYCKKAEISERSTHKIRKTYISTLIDEEVNINTIRKMVGHEDERTTYRSYCFDRHRKNDIEDKLEEIFEKKSS